MICGRVPFLSVLGLFFFSLTILFSLLVSLTVEEDAAPLGGRGDGCGVLSASTDERSSAIVVAVDLTGLALPTGLVVTVTVWVGRRSSFMLFTRT